MSHAYNIWVFIIRHRYWLVSILGIVIVGFVDDNSFLRRVEYEMQIRDLERRITDYNIIYERDEQKLRELRMNPKAITKIARENYFMKADDEDIFVLSDDETSLSNNETTD